VTEAASLLISRWASRESLTPRALRPGGAAIDTRSFAEILAETVHFSRRLLFVGQDGHGDGSWEELLAADRTAMLALLATIDGDGRSAAVDALARAVRDEEEPAAKGRLLAALVESALSLADEIDRWLGAAEQLGPESADGARHLVEHSVREVLGPRLRRLLAIVVAAERDQVLIESVIVRVAHFRAVWLIETIALEPRRLGGDGWIDFLIDEIVEHVHAFVAGVAELAARSAAALDSSLQTATHAPQMGLLMAFIRLLRHSQDGIDGLPERIASFYQQAYLREAPRKAQPDSLFLALKPIEGGVRPRIEAGTIFPAGKDKAGRTIAFASDRALDVTGARIAQLRIWQPVAGGDGAIKQVNAAASPVAADGTIGLNLFAAPALPPASTGLIVASPALELKTGTRNVQIQFFGLDPDIPMSAAAAEELLRKAFRVSFSSPAGWIEMADFTISCAPGTMLFDFTIAADGPPLAAGRDGPGLPAVRLALSQAPVQIGDDSVSPWAVLGGVRIFAIEIFISVQGLGGLAVSTPSGAASAPGVAAFGTPPVPGGWLQIDHPALAAGTIDEVRLGLTWLGLPPDPDGFTDYYRQYVVRPDRSVGAPLITTKSFTVDIKAAGRVLNGASLFTPIAESSSASPTPAPVSEPAPAPVPVHEPVATDPIEPEAMPVAADIPQSPTDPAGSEEDPGAAPGAQPAQALFPAPAPALQSAAMSAGQSGAIRDEAPPPPADPSAGDTAALRGTSWFTIGAVDVGAGGGSVGSGIRVTLTGPAYGFGDSLYPANLAYAATQAAEAEERRERDDILIRQLLDLIAKLLGMIKDAAAAVAKGVADAALRALKLVESAARQIRDLLMPPDPYDEPGGEAPSGPPAPPPPPPPPGGGATAFPNPPWRPMLAGIEVGYDARAAWPRSDEAESAVALFHIAPMDGPIPVPLEGKPSLFPALPKQACFDLGITGWPIGGELSLLFLMGAPAAGGSAAASVAFSWKSGADWTPLPASAIVADGTNGLTSTGILTLKAPAGTAPAWLRATAAGPAGGFPTVARILPDSLTATRIVSGVETDLAPVAAGTIASAPGARGIAKVEQPLPSFGGSAAEDSDGLPQRTSARLRHRERAVLDWDIERLLLDRFPDIARVRVLPARTPDKAHAAGHVTIVVIPSRDSAHPPDPVRPATPPELRGAIKAWLEQRSSAFAQFHVVDPVYAAVDIAVSAFFSDPGGGASLQADLAALLSPWADPGLDLPDEARPRMLRAAILRFVRTRPYVTAPGHVEATISGDGSGAPWRVAVAGKLDVTALTERPAGGC